MLGGLEGFFNAPVFAGMKRKDGDAAAGVKTLRQDAQEGVEGGELFVDFDTDRLENAAHGEFAFLFSGGGERATNRGGEFHGGGKIPTGELVSDGSGVWFVGVGQEKRSEFLRGNFLQPMRGRDPARRIHAHVERTFVFERKAAVRIVELHGGSSEVGQDEVGAAVTASRQSGGESGKV